MLCTVTGEEILLEVVNSQVQGNVIVDNNAHAIVDVPFITSDGVIRQEESAQVSIDGKLPI